MASDVRIILLPDLEAFRVDPYPALLPFLLTEESKGLRLDTLSLPGLTWSAQAFGRYLLADRRVHHVRLPGRKASHHELMLARIETAPVGRHVGQLRCQLRLALGAESLHQRARRNLIQLATQAHHDDPSTPG